MTVALAWHPNRSFSRPTHGRVTPPVFAPQIGYPRHFSSADLLVPRRALPVPAPPPPPRPGLRGSLAAWAARVWDQLLGGEAHTLVHGVEVKADNTVRVMLLGLVWLLGTMGFLVWEGVDNPCGWMRW